MRPTKVHTHLLSLTHSLTHSLARGRIARFSREAMTHEQAYELLILLDRVSNEVCSVIDAAQLCMNVHTNESFISAADASYGKLASYIHVLNSDTALYKRYSFVRISHSLTHTHFLPDSLIAITSNATLLSSLSSECQIFALDLKREFESEGIHLLGDKRNNLANIQNEIVKTETSFMQNAAKGSYLLTHSLLLTYSLTHSLTHSSRKVTAPTSTCSCWDRFQSMREAATPMNTQI